MVVILGAIDEDAVRRRIANVAARARATQPQRRVVDIARRNGALEVLTSSQKLAHRVARELEKAFGGLEFLRFVEALRKMNRCDERFLYAARARPTKARTGFP